MKRGKMKMEKMMRCFIATTFLMIALLSQPALADNHAGDAVKGAKVFKKCRACHMIGKNARNIVGPPLNNIIGGKVGATKGYKYSKGMAAFAKIEPIWTEETLSAYLLKPNKLVKGTRMTFAGLKKQSDRDNVIAYLKQYSPENAAAE